MPASTAERTETTTDRGPVAPFGVEIDTKRNGDVLLQSIPGIRLRGAVSPSKTVVNNPQSVDNSELPIPRDQAIHLGAIGNIPGQQILVNPATLEYRIVDPLHGDTKRCEQIVKALKANGQAVANKIDGVPESSGRIDVNRMKTLCRELIYLLNDNDAKVVKGALPKLSDVEELPGDFLLNPGSRVHNSQPSFEKDLPAWVQNLAAQGG